MVPLNNLKTETMTKKVLIVSSVERANALMRRYEKKQNSFLVNLKADTIENLAKEIIMYSFSRKPSAEIKDKEYDFPYIYINDDEGRMLFRNLLFGEAGKSLNYFTNETLFKSLATSNELLSKVNLVRGNGWKDENALKGLSDSRVDRISDLVTLVESYEEELNKGKNGKEYLDRIKAIDKALEIMADYDEAEEIIETIFHSSFYVLKEDKDEFSGKELKFLERLEQLSGKEIEEVYAFGDGAEVDREVTVEDLSDLKGKTEFFKGFGTFSEAEYIANDIVSKKIPLGSVHVLYMADHQREALESALIGNGIDAAFVSGRTETGNPVNSLAMSIIDWARDNYSERALEGIFSNGYLSILVDDESKETNSAETDLEEGEVEEEDLVEAEKEEIEETEETEDAETEAENAEKKDEVKKKNLLSGSKYFNYVVDGRWSVQRLGWGFSRNRGYGKQILEDANIKATEDEKWKTKANELELIVGMHNSLLDIFCNSPGDDFSYSETDKLRPAIILDKMETFIKKYTRKSKTRNLGLDGLASIKKALLLDDTDYSLTECLSILEKLILSESTKEEERANAVKVEKLNNWIVLERDNVYLIGMALKDVESPVTQSAVLDDDEIESLLGNGFKPTAKAWIEKGRSSIYRTLATFSGERISIGFSSYDTNFFTENNPSTIYTSLLQALSGMDIDQVPVLEKGNPKEDKLLVDKKIKDTGFDKFDVEKMTSASKMEVLMSCPRRYAYESVYSIPDGSFNEFDGSMWLAPADSGILVHGILEEYISRVMIKPKTEDLGDEVDEATLCEIFEKGKEEAKNKVPYPSDGRAEKEAADKLEKIREYLDKLHKEMSIGGADYGWRPLEVELGFVDAEYPVVTYDSTPLTIKYRGFIDRIDYKLDDQNKKVWLRILDYKSGQKKYKESELKDGKLMQPVLYKHAVMDSGFIVEDDGKKVKALDYIKKKIEALEKNNLKGWDIKCESAQYVFPIYNEELIVDKAYDDCSVNRFKIILTAIDEKKTYPNAAEMEAFLDELENGKKETADILAQHRKKMYKAGDYGTCDYCLYKELCDV